MNEQLYPRSIVAARHVLVLLYVQRHTETALRTCNIENHTHCTQGNIRQVFIFAYFAPIVSAFLKLKHKQYLKFRNVSHASTKRKKYTLERQNISTAAMAQWVRGLATQAKGWVLVSQQRQT